MMRNTILGKTVTVAADSAPFSRPAGDTLPEIRCGQVTDQIDMKAQPAYVLGTPDAAGLFTGTVIAVLHRPESREALWVVAPPELQLHQAQLTELFSPIEPEHCRIVAQHEQSCGVIPYRPGARGIEYLLVLQRGSHTWSFPKGHMEAYETEQETALRELQEEVGLSASLLPDFRMTVRYSLGHRRYKTIVLFLGQLNQQPQLRHGEILEARWVAADNALQLLEHKPYAEILRRAEQTIHASAAPEVDA